MGKRAKSIQLSGQRDFRRDLQSLDELESTLIAGFRAPLTITIGTVVILGLEQLDIAGPTGTTADIFPPGQGVEDVGDIALGADAGGIGDFIVRWANSISRYIGAEEVQHFLLAWRQRHRGHRA